MKKITSLFAITALSLTFAATGCKKKNAEETKDPAMKPEEKGSGDMKKEEGKPEEKKEEAKTAPAGGGDLPAECTDYKAAMDKLMACDKAKAAAGPMKEAFDNAWKTMEGLPAESRAAAGPGCKAAADGVKTTLTSMGC